MATIKHCEEDVFISLLERYNLKIEDVSKKISDIHLDEISQSCCSKWRQLLSCLGMKKIVKNDIDRLSSSEDEKRSSFLSKWADEKGSSATYEKLIRALLKRRCMNDAETVCKLIQPKISQSSGHREINRSGHEPGPHLPQPAPDHTSPPGLPGMARRAASSDPKKAHKATPPAPDVPFPRKGEGKYKGKSKHEQKSVSSPDLQSPQTPPSSSIPAVKGETKKIMDPRGKSQLKERQKEKCVKEEAACKSKGSHKGMKSRKQDRSKERDVERHHPSSSSRSTPPRLRTPDYPLDDAIPDREEELGKKARQHGHRYGSRHGKDRHYHPSSPSPQPKSFTRKRYYYSPPPPKGDRRRSRRSPVDGHPQHRYYSRSPPYHGSPPPMYRVRSSRGGSPPHRSPIPRAHASRHHYESPPFDSYRGKYMRGRGSPPSPHHRYPFTPPPHSGGRLSPPGCYGKCHSASLSPPPRPGHRGRRERSPPPEPMRALPQPCDDRYDSRKRHTKRGGSPSPKDKYKEYVCGVRVEKDGNRAAKRRLSTSTQDQNSVKKKGTVEPEGDIAVCTKQQLDPNVRTDLQDQLQNSSDEIQVQYASYVLNLCNCLIHKKVTVVELRIFLSNLPFQCGLPEIQDKLQEADTLYKIFHLVGAECASFFHYDIFQCIQNEFCEASDCESNPKLKYSEHFKAFINLHKISEFFDTNPQLKMEYTGHEKLVFKIDSIQMSDKLVRVVELRHAVAKILKVKSSELRFVNIEGGCMLVTFLTSAAVAKTIPELSADQKEEFQKLSILYIKCGDYSLVLPDMSYAGLPGMHDSPPGPGRGFGQEGPEEELCALRERKQEASSDSTDSCSDKEDNEADSHQRNKPSKPKKVSKKPKKEHSDEVGGARVGSRAVKRRLPTSPTQEQSSAKKKRGEVCDANTKKDGSKATKRDLSDWSSAKSKVCIIEVSGVRVEKDSRRAAKRRLSTSSTQDQISVKKEGTVEPEVLPKKDGNKAAKKDISASPTLDWSSARTAKPKGCAYSGSQQVKDFLNQNPRVHFVDSRVFFSCFTKIRSWLDLDLLAAYLFKYGVVKNGGDFNALTSPYLTSQVKMNSLINLLEKAGTEGFMFLYMCLSESSDESLGHKDAVQELDHAIYKEKCSKCHKEYASASTRVSASSCLDSRSTVPGSRLHADAHSNWRTSSSEIGPSGFFRDHLDREEGVGAKSMEKIEAQFQVSDEERKGVFDRVQGRKRRRSDEISSTIEEENSVVSAKVRRNGGDNVYRGGNLQRSFVQEDPLQSLISNLKARYTRSNFFTKASGPFFRRLEFINLALVKKRNVNEDEKLRDVFLRETLHGSVEDIVKKKERINHHSEIFNYSSSGSQKCVLVEGSPGVGKTMLAMKVCQDWAEGEILQEYDLVLLVQLRRFQTQASLSLEDLVRIYCEGDHAKSVADVLSKSGGERTLLIFEGWDELHPSHRQEMSFFFDVITADRLPKASVMVTSRPTATDKLADYMDERHIEVLGFRPKQIAQYVEQHYPQKADMILKHLDNFPNLKALAHIPLTLSIICKVVKNEETLPSTLTELYDRYICQVLFQATQKDHTSLVGLEGLEDLPLDLRTELKELCEVALKGLVDRRCVFTQKDLAHSVPSSFDGHGLLTTHRVPAKAGESILYQFNHLSIQEFLAAFQIQSLPSQECIQLLREFREDKQFQNVWKFLAGITKLKDEAFSETILDTTKKSNKSQLFLMHCLFEAHDREICRLAASKLERKLNLNNMNLNATDCLCAAYAIVSAGGKWDVDLRNCNIGANGLEIFKQNMMAQDEQDQANQDEFSMKKFDLTHNQVTLEACHHLAEMLRSDVKICTLYLGTNKFKDEGVEVLCSALSVNSTLSFVHFSHCGLTSQSGQRIAEMLEENTTLSELYTGFEQLRDDGVIPISRALTTNHTLADLSLTQTRLTIKSIEELQVALAQNDSLKILRLDRNNLRLAECKVIAKITSTNSSLVLIDVSKNPIGDDGFGIILDALMSNPKSTIEKLGCFGCEITAKGLLKLVAFFEVTQIFKGIQLGCNDLGDEGAKCIGKAVVANITQSVTQILLEDTKFSDGAKDDLKKVVESLERPPEKELDINYIHHAQVVQKRNKS